MPHDPIVRLRKLALALPQAHEVAAWGEPTFRVRNKLFAIYASANTHHGEGRPAVWCKAIAANQSLMVRAAPARFFVPPYVGPSGWVGVWLDGAVDWAELAELLRDAYVLTVPKRLAALLDAPGAAREQSTPRSARAAGKVANERGSAEKTKIERGVAKTARNRGGATTRRGATKNASGKKVATTQVAKPPRATKQATTRRAAAKKATKKGRRRAP